VGSPIRAWSLIRNEETIVLLDKAAMQLAIAKCKEMAVIPVNKVVDRKKNNLRKGGLRRRGARGAD
jgi:hypothetical protein